MPTGYVYRFGMPLVWCAKVGIYIWRGSSLLVLIVRASSKASKCETCNNMWASRFFCAFVRIEAFLTAKHHPNMDYHIGKMIKAELERQGRSVKWFEDQINRSHSACYDIFRSHDINTELLNKISKVLDHNFFKDLSDQMYGKTAQNCTEIPPKNA